MNAQSVQIAQERRDLIVLTTVVHQSRCRIEHGLQTIYQTPCDAVECDAGVVESRQNKRGDEGQKNRLADGATDAAYVMQSCKTTDVDRATWFVADSTQRLMLID